MNHFLPDCGSEGVRNREELKLSHQESMSTVESGQSGGVERAARWQSVQGGNQYKVAISTRWQSAQGGKQYKVASAANNPICVTSFLPFSSI